MELAKKKTKKVGVQVFKKTKKVGVQVFLPGLFQVFCTYEKTGRPDAAEALRRGYAESGYAAALRKATAVELAKHASQGGVAIDAAINYALAGDSALALDWLEKAYTDRDPNMPFVGCIPIFDPLRAAPRFQALLRKMNLPQ